MHIALRTSPMHFCLTGQQPLWREIRQMQVAWQLFPRDEEAQRRQQAALCDASCFDRFGLKGPQAAEWLQARNVPVPEGHNQWLPLESGGYVLRLGHTEFLLEDTGGKTVPGLKAALGLGLPGVYAVARQDAAIILAGKRSEELLLQVCGVNFRAETRQPRRVVMTSMAGVSVVVLQDAAGGPDTYRIWCDSSFGPYLWRTLVGISEELGGGAVGLGCFHEHLSQQ